MSLPIDPLAAMPSRPSRRRVLRRAVQLDCQVLSDVWQGAAPHRVTDLSAEGLWLSTPLALDAGEELLITMTPPRWKHEDPLVAMGEVMRVGLYRRHDELGQSGMGVRFTDMDEGHRRMLEQSLRGLPPPLPARPRAAKLSDAARELIESRPSMLLLDDGPILMRAEAELLTASRRPLRTPAVVTQGLAQVIELRPRGRLRRAGTRPSLQAPRPAHASRA